MLAARNLDYGQLNASAGMHAGPAGLLSMYVPCCLLVLPPVRTASAGCLSMSVLLPSTTTIHHCAPYLHSISLVDVSLACCHQLQRSVTAISARLPLLLSAAVSRGMVFGKGALVPYMMSMQPTDAGDVIMEVHIHTYARVHMQQATSY